LRAALREGDCETVARCLEAGQSLDQIVPYGKPVSSCDVTNYDQPLLIKEILQSNEAAVFTMLKFKEVLDLNIVHAPGMCQITPLGAAASRLLPRVVNALLLAGASVEHPSAPFPEYHHPFSGATMLGKPDKRTQMDIAHKLLFCGVEPWFYKHGPMYNDYAMIDKLAKVAEKWLASLSCAKSYFTKIFDDLDLETLLAEFLYNKTHLERLIWENGPAQELLRRSRGRRSRPSGNLVGDWICPSCDWNNYAKRVRCFQCDKPKPQSQSPRRRSVSRSRSGSHDR